MLPCVATGENQKIMGYRAGFVVGFSAFMEGHHRDGPLLRRSLTWARRLQLRRATSREVNGTVASSGNKVVQLIINPGNNVLKIFKTTIFVPSEFICIVVRNNKVQEYI